MNTQKLFSNRGFSLVSTLIALAIGGVLAALVATLMSQSVQLMRDVVTRDEMSEFAIFVKNVLNNDLACRQALNGQRFRPIGAENARLNVAYEGASAIAAGTSMSNGNLIVNSLTIENNPSVPPTSMNFSGVAVTRYQARVRMQVRERNGTGYRERVFEVPVLVNNARMTIETCNSEINLEDACQAMGFVLKDGACVPDKVCLAGGYYKLNKDKTICQVPNPTMDPPACDCISGYDKVEVGSVNIETTRSGKKGPVNTNFERLYLCFQCP